MYDLLHDTEIPLGLGMALAENVDALSRFSQLTAQQRQAFLGKCKAVTSKAEMQNLVRTL